MTHHTPCLNAKETVAQSSSTTLTDLMSHSMSVTKDRTQESQLAFTLFNQLTTFPTINHTGFVLLVYITAL